MHYPTLLSFGSLMLTLIFLDAKKDLKYQDLSPLTVTITRGYGQNYFITASLTDAKIGIDTRLHVLTEITRVRQT